MARPTRESTERNYQSKWSCFRDWCRKKGTDPFKATIPLILRFIVHLFRSGTCTFKTIRSFRAALGEPMRLLGLPFKGNPDIAALLAHYSRKVPVILEREPPAWNFNVALNYLKSKPFEPLRETSLRELTRKTNFLLMSALSCRMGEIQAFSPKVGWGDNDSFVTISYVPTFVAKMEAVGKPVVREFTIHALSKHTDDPEELLLCPVRALRHYLLRLESLKLSPKHLFVSPSCPSRFISKNAASYFVKSVILDSHKPENLPRDVKIFKNEIMT